jgi:hypothetical protein
MWATPVNDEVAHAAGIHRRQITDVAGRTSRLVGHEVVVAERHEGDVAGTQLEGLSTRGQPNPGSAPYNGMEDARSHFSGLNPPRGIEGRSGED